MRIAVVAGPAAGHALPAAGAALALRTAGHEPVVVTGHRWLPGLRRDGLVADELPLAGPTGRDGDFGHVLWGRSVAMAPALAALLRSYAVDAVVADTLTVAGGFAAELLGLPWVELVPHPLADPSRGLPPYGTGLAPGRTPVGHWRDALLRRLTARSLRLAAWQRAEARSALGLAGNGGSAGRLVATLPALEPPRPDWPADAVVVGPLAWEPADRDLVLPPGEAPLVVVVASTAAGGAPGLVAAALAGLAERGSRGRVRVAATCFEPPPATPGWAVAGSGRQAPLLAEARRTGGMVISGAGHGMVAKALGHGLPLVLVPGGGDQRDLAARVRRLGAGVVLPGPRLTPPRLETAVGRVCARPGYRAAAERAGAAAAASGPAYLAEVVERMITRGDHVIAESGSGSGRSATDGRAGG